MDFSEITLRDKSLFDEHLARHDTQISELTFTNLFAWRNFYKFRYTIIGSLLCIIAVPLKSEPFAMIPVGSAEPGELSAAIRSLRDYFRSRGWRPAFRKITAEELQHFKDLPGFRTEIVYDRDNSDYLYLSSDLIFLKGKKFDGKRNHINRFKRNHTFEYVPLDCSLLDECSRILTEWCREKNCNCQEGDYCERYANMELLYNFRTLGCRGALLKVDGAAYEAFTVGEMLNRDTAVIHVEKANTRVDGLYTLINQQFCAHEWREATYINREQDLGLEGMRKAKLSYNPVKMIDKYTVYVE
jgi:hypothetical protein